jgi:hypothetical protein
MRTLLLFFTLETASPYNSVSSLSINWRQIHLKVFLVTRVARRSQQDARSSSLKTLVGASVHTELFLFSNFLYTQSSLNISKQNLVLTKVLKHTILGRFQAYVAQSSAFPFSSSSLILSCNCFVNSKALQFSLNPGTK